MFTPIDDGLETVDVLPSVGRYIPNEAEGFETLGEAAAVPETAASGAGNEGAGVAGVGAAGAAAGVEDAGADFAEDDVEEDDNTAEKTAG